MTDKPANPVLSVLGKLLEELLNRAVALDPDGAALLAPLDGRAVELAWTSPDIGLRAQVAGSRIAIGPRAAAEADLSMRGTLAGFANLLLAERGLPSLAGGKVQVSGDAELARRLAGLVRDYAPDLDAAAARGLGPAAGPLVARGVRDGLAFAAKSARTFATDAADYVREESRDAVAREELDAFLDDVDRARDDAERLDARIARLAARRLSGQGSGT
jgi:ubiquinone biosynthesis protein UbiJ